MEKCSPVEMRKNMEAAKNFMQFGIDFVPIPVKKPEHKKELIQMCSEILSELEAS